ncbi:HEPN domain-containing protein [Neglecta sp. X4]|uniref:HEPN domain-containing protein n=1 Tax=unclassified Neglectibacter TaxID=2632164 RepID=UPI001369F8D6|nr:MULTISPECIES: HEPN domain-containing protein [unclassified Neglectibacter]NBI18698.1 HEPN domain-containing protein [Neglectibacter sp. 59]NBJ74376.1 HEPN domain-containing protein [Neglectibacter sp. X4]NCE82140.1 HEPN domain-containing protein [Neglectibacter sp. X58]
MAGQPVCSRSWLEKAHLDLYSAECLMEHHPAPYEIICFHCQQAVEKSLKCILSLYREEIPKTHDCGLLCQMCGEIHSGFEVWEDICPRFAPFSVVVRYPNELDVEKSDAEWALETSRKIYEFTAMKLELLQKEPLEQNGGMEQTMS